MLWDSDAYLQLRNRWSRITPFDILGLSRDERCYSNVLGWILDPKLNCGLGLAPLRRFVRILNSKVKQTNVSELMYGIEHGVRNVDIDLEHPIAVGGYRGCIDIFIEIRCQDADGVLRVERIVVENKVCSREHRLGEHEGAPFQTIGYCMWGNETFENAPVYVFLAPDEITCACNDFIRVNYQELEDMVLSPSVIGIQDEGWKNFLLDFITILGVSNRHPERKVMAVTQEERELIRRFWNENQEQLRTMFEIIDEDEGINVAPEFRRRIHELRARERTEILFFIGDEQVGEEAFKRRLIEVGHARRILVFRDQSEIENQWDAEHIGPDTDLRNNIQSTQFWRQRIADGLAVVRCRVD